MAVCWSVAGRFVARVAHMAIVAALVVTIVQSAHEASAALVSKTATVSTKSTGSAGAVMSTSRTPQEVRPTPPPRWSGPAPTDVYAIGDSVMLGAQPCLEHLGYTVNAQGSRSVRAGLVELAQAARSRQLSSWVVVHLGTNGGMSWRDLDSIVNILGPDRQVVLMTVQLPDDPTRYTFEGASNLAIRAAALRFPNVRVADWQALSDRYSGMVWSEGIHLTPLGCWAYADLVSSALAAKAGSRTPTPRS